MKKLKKLFKRCLLVFVAVIGVFAFSGCLDDDKGDSGNNPPPPKHTHKYADEWSNDQMGHWIACIGDNIDECDAPTKSYGNHNYSNGACTVCGRLKAHTCEFGEYLHDSKHHWQECSGCDATTSKVGHTFSGKVCTVCGYEQAGSTTTTHASRDLEIITTIAGVGSATLVKLPDGKDMLIDAGDGTADSVFYLHSLIDEHVSDMTIEYFVLTNTNPWRTAGVPEIFYNYTVLNFYRPDVKSSHAAAANLSSDYNSGNSVLVEASEEYALALEAAANETGCSVKVVDEASCDISYSFFDTKNNSHSYKIDFMTPIAAAERVGRFKNSIIISIEYKGAVTLVTSDVNNGLIDAYCDVYGTQKDVDVLVTSYYPTDEAKYAISRSDLRGTNFLEKISLTDGDYSIVIPVNAADGGELGSELGDYSTVYSTLEYYAITAKVSTTGVLSVTAE